MRKVPLYIIKKAVCEYFSTPDDVIFQKTRRTEVVKPRQWYHYLASTMTNKTLAQIGDYEGAGFDHTTVLHSRETIRGDISIYKKSKESEIDLIYKIKEMHDIYMPSNLTVCRDFPLTSFTLKRAL